MKYIAQIREGERISDIYLCKVKNVAKTKAGKTYYSLMLQDKTGTIDAKVWDLSAGIDHFESMDYIKIDAEVTSFQGALQLNVKRVRRAGEGEYVPSDYLPTSSKDVKVMYSELVSIIDSVKNEYLNKLLKSFFVDDKEFVNKFCSHSAAKSIHHGFVGGLLEHTLSVAKICNYMSSYYTAINRDLLITAALFHDMGKVDELSGFPENDYTDDGQLLGHIIIGVEMVGAHIRDISGFPPTLASQLKHCILAHHGEYEYGSPKKPAIIEALALNLADNTDAKLQTMTELLYDSDPMAQWLGYNRLFDSNIRRTEK